MSASSVRSVFWIIAALIVVGLLVRAPRLSESLWYDEIAGWSDYGQFGPRAIVTTFRDPANHIAQTLASWFTVEALGLDRFIGPEAALRLPALVFSLLAIPMMYLLGRDAAGRAATALAAAALAAILPVAVLEGVEARGYSMMIFCAAGSTWALLRLQKAPTPRLLVVYAVLTALGIWAQLMTVYVPIGHALWLAIGAMRRDPSVRAGWSAGAITLAAAFTLALYAPVVDDLLRIRSGFTITGEDQPGLLGREGVEAILQIGGSWSWWAAVPGLVLVLIGTVRAVRETALRRAALLALLGLPIMLATVAVVDAWIYARFTLFAFPGFVVLAAAGLASVWESRRWLGAAALCAVVGVAAADLATRPPKQPLRDAALYVVEHGGANATVAVVGLRLRALSVYAGDLDLRFSLRHGAEPDLGRLLDETGAEWVVLYYPESLPVERYEQLRARGFQEAARFDGWVDWTNGDVVVYRR